MWAASTTILGRNGGVRSYRWFNDNNLNDNQIDWGGVLPGDKLGTPSAASSNSRNLAYFVLGLTANLTPYVTNEAHFSYTRNYWRYNRLGGLPYVSGIPDGSNSANNRHFRYPFRARQHGYPGSRTASGQNTISTTATP